jgi:hypothetical protein
MTFPSIGDGRRSPLRNDAGRVALRDHSLMES